MTENKSTPGPKTIPPIVDSAGVGSATADSAAIGSATADSAGVGSATADSATVDSAIAVSATIDSATAGRAIVGSAVVVIATVWQLRLMGRAFWCACGKMNLWVGDAWSSHTSQHLFDPYSFTHILHGFLFCAILTLLFSRKTFEFRLWCAITLESAWEILENSNLVIQRYRTMTSAFGYEGDSIVNSLGDILSCTVGFMTARKLGFRRALVVFIAIEVALLYLIRDNLILNIVMLMYPSDTLKNWQIGH